MLIFLAIKQLHAIPFLTFLYVLCIVPSKMKKSVKILIES